MTITATPPKMTTTNGSTADPESTLARDAGLALLPDLRAGAADADPGPRARPSRVPRGALHLLREPGRGHHGLCPGGPRLPHPPARHRPAAPSMGPARRVRRGRRAPERDDQARGLRGDRARRRS